MQITRRRLKEIIKEEMDHLAETGDLEALTESEKMAFQIILEKLSPEQLQEMGLTRIDEEQPDAQQKKRHEKMHADYDKKIKDLKDQIDRAKKRQPPSGATKFQKDTFNRKKKELIAKLKAELEKAQQEKKALGHPDDPQAAGMRS
tara:strand:+ start:77 stop:514 length:438 start_codon:yes stop_codon:yes gene_type:complete